MGRSFFGERRVAEETEGIGADMEQLSFDGRTSLREKRKRGHRGFEDESFGSVFEMKLISKDAEEMPLPLHPFPFEMSPVELTPDLANEVLRASHRTPGGVEIRGENRVFF